MPATGRLGGVEWFSSLILALAIEWVSSRFLIVQCSASTGLAWWLFRGQWKNSRTPAPLPTWRHLFRCWELLGRIQELRDCRVTAIGVTFPTPRNFGIFFVSGLCPPSLLDLRYAGLLFWAGSVLKVPFTISQPVWARWAQQPWTFPPEGPWGLGVDDVELRQFQWLQ